MKKSFYVLVSEGEENEKRQRLVRKKQQEAQGEQVRLGLQDSCGCCCCVCAQRSLCEWLLVSNSQGLRWCPPSSSSETSFLVLQADFEFRK